MAKVLPRLKALALIALLALCASAYAAEEDKGVLANLISRALSSPSMTVSIGAVDGVLSSDASISDIILSDRSGPWLKVDKVRLVWNRLALFSRRLEVDQLTIGRMEFLRRPLPSETPPPDTGAQQPILPELPVKVIVKQFGVQKLSLGEPVVGVAARLNISGKATLGPPSEGLDLTLTAQRLDAPGDFKALLTYIPATDRLTLNVNSAEPAGGIFAHLANLPGLPPVKLAFNGAGALDNFTAKLDFNAGADVWANGQVIVARQGAGRRLTLDLDSRLEGLSPRVTQPIFAGQTTLKGDVQFNDDSSIALPGGLHLVSAAARLDFEGGRSANGLLDLKVHAGAIPGSTTVGKLDLNASINGPLSSPTIEGAFDAGQIRVEQGSVERVEASFRASPNGPLTEEKTRILFEGQARVNGLALADPAFAQAVGRDLTLTMRGSASSSGEATFDALDLSAPNFSAQYSGLLSPGKIRGKANIVAHDLSRFALLAGGTFKGEARIVADLDGAPRYGALSATIDAHASKLATNFPMFDRATGGTLDLTGAARVTPGGGFGFSDLLARGEHGSAELNGEYGRDKVDLGARVEIPQTQVLDPRVTGKAEIAGALTGSPSDLTAAFKANLGEGRLLDRKTSGVALEALANHVTGLIDANASLSGDVDGHALQGAAHVARHDDGSWAIDNLGLSLASARVAGALIVGADALATGDLSFSATNLDDLSPLVLTKLTGALQAKASASTADGKQLLSVAANSDRMTIDANRLEGLKIDLKIADLWGAKIVSGFAQLARAEVAGQSITGVKLTATGSPSASDLELSGNARGLAINARGRLFGGPPTRFELASFVAQGGGQRITLAAPATVTYGGDGLDIKNLTFLVGAGRLSLSGHSGSTLALKANATSLPLSALDFASPGLGLSGVADGEATIGGTPSNPTGEWRVRVQRVSVPQMRNAGLPVLDVAGSGRLAGGRTSLDVTINAGVGNAVRLTGSAPLTPDGPLDVKVDGSLDARLANSMLSVSGRHAAGSLAIAFQVRGTMAKPQAQGTVRLIGGELRDDQTGFKLTGVTGTFVANGETIRIDHFAGTTPNGGSISATGEVRLDPAAGFPGTIRLTGQHAQLVTNDIVTATADMALTISGPLAQKPRVDGRITIVGMDIAVPDRFNSVAAPIPGTKHLNPTATARARLALIAKAKGSKARAPLFDATLALTISAANRIFVRGRGIYVELGGDLHVAGSARDPQVTGGFNLLRGSLLLLSSRLTFTRGNVRFHGDAMPDLDLVAETSTSGVTARISVTCPAIQPAFQISSNPSLPEDEILSRVLFQRPSGSLSAFQALQLANAVATLSGQVDAFEHLRKSLGVDSLDISSSATGGALVGATRAINDRVSVGVTTGARPQDNGVSLNFDVTRHVRLQAGVDASGGSSAGVGLDWEYK
ncbi:MAG TPA: translocation/assembly module TamB domain-containing protein [Roseiarcus sp.]